MLTYVVFGTVVIHARDYLHDAHLHRTFPIILFDAEDVSERGSVGYQQQGSTRNLRRKIESPQGDSLKNLARNLPKHSPTGGKGCAHAPQSAFS